MHDFVARNEIVFRFYNYYKCDSFQTEHLTIFGVIGNFQFNGNTYFGFQFTMVGYVLILMKRFSLLFFYFRF